MIPHANTNTMYSSRGCFADNSAKIWPDPEHKFSWYDVLFPGELKSDPDVDCGHKTVVQLAGYVREAFRVRVGR